MTPHRRPLDVSPTPSEQSTFWDVLRAQLIVRDLGSDWTVLMCCIPLLPFLAVAALFLIPVAPFALYVAIVAGSTTEMT